MRLNWSDPILLKNYREAPKGPGIYAIGEPEDPGKPVELADEICAYFGRWPRNLSAGYVGISESASRGVRGRLSSHARGKGNKSVAERVRAGAELWFITVTGEDVVEYEALFMCLKTDGQFEWNKREEAERSARRRMVKIRAEMGPDSCAFYDNLDMGEHGEGM